MLLSLLLLPLLLQLLMLGIQNVSNRFYYVLRKNFHGFNSNFALYFSFFLSLNQAVALTWSMDISAIVTQDTLVLTVMRMSMSACHILAFTVLK